MKFGENKMMDKEKRSIRIKRKKKYQKKKQEVSKNDNIR